MRPISDSAFEVFESAALEGASRLREFLHPNSDKEGFQKAKLGAVAISGYARLRASESNRMAVELMAAKQSQGQNFLTE